MVCRCPSAAVHASRAADQDREYAQLTEQGLRKQIAKLETEIAQLTAKADQYDILEVTTAGGCLILRVKYPSCKSCAFEGIKILVFAGVDTVDALQWKRIDPHFRRPPFAKNEAPCPAARFPNTEEGWENAIRFAKLIGGGE